MTTANTTNFPFAPKGPTTCPVCATKALVRGICTECGAAIGGNSAAQTLTEGLVRYGVKCRDRLQGASERVRQLTKAKTALARATVLLEKIDDDTLRTELADILDAANAPVWTLAVDAQAQAETASRTSLPVDGLLREARRAARNEARRSAARARANHYAD